MLDICHSPMSSRPKMKGVVYFVLKNLNAGAIKRVLNSYGDAMCFLFALDKKHIYRDEVECNTKNNPSDWFFMLVKAKWSVQPQLNADCLTLNIDVTSMKLFEANRKPTFSK